MTYDIFKQTTIGSHMTHFVLDTSIQITCCQPQVLAFDSKEVAEKFIKEFAGNVYQSNLAIQKVNNRMKGYNGCS